MKRCNNGHFYDETQHTHCPYCSVANLDLSVTMPIRNTPAASPPPPAASFENRQASVPPPLDKTIAKSQASANDGKTVGILRSRIGFDPVVGWLVCIDGPERGKDYRLRSEKNFVGRSAQMDVSITGDAGISRENHAIISYDPRNNLFKVLPGEGHGLTYLNGDEVDMPQVLHSRDVIELGQTKLMFIPFCEECFQWK